LQAAEKKFLVNDLEKPAFMCNPDLLALKEKVARQMDPGASGVMMSGSGTSIYALVRSNFPTDKVSTAVSEVLKAYPTVQHFQCEFLNKKDDIDSWY
jgi:4-diphosphocytidyl-2C-methyl-D-erythritol kinase